LHRQRFWLQSAGGADLIIRASGRADHAASAGGCFIDAISDW